MHNLHRPQILKCQNNLSRHVLCKQIFQTSLPFEKLRQAALWTILDQHIQLVLVLERLVKLYHCWIFQARKYASFDKHLLDPALIDKSTQKHFFECVMITSFAVRFRSRCIWANLLLQCLIIEAYFIDSAICTFANFPARIEISSCKQRCGCFIKWPIFWSGFGRVFLLQILRYFRDHRFCMVLRLE